MSKNAVTDWDTNPANNTDIAGTNINVGCPPSDVGIFMRTNMAQIASWIADAAGPLLKSGGTITGNLTISGTLTFTGGFPNGATIVDGIGNQRNVGYRGLPPTLTKTASYQIALTDRDMMIPTNSGITVPLNATVAFAIGDMVVVYNNSGSNITITQTAGVTLRLEGSATTGNRTVSQRSMAYLKKVGTDEWLCSGVGVS